MTAGLPSIPALIAGAVFIGVSDLVYVKIKKWWTKRKSNQQKTA